MSMRSHVIHHLQPEVRRREYLKLVLGSESESVSDRKVKQWHRFLNSHFLMVLEIHVGVRQKDQQIAVLRTALEASEENAMREKKSVGPRKEIKRKFEQGTLIDKSQQTGITYDVAQNKTVQLKPEQHGAWRFVSTYESRV